MIRLRTWIEREEYLGTVKPETGGATVYMPRWFYVAALSCMFAVGFSLGWALA